MRPFERDLPAVPFRWREDVRRLMTAGRVPDNQVLWNLLIGEVEEAVLADLDSSAGELRALILYLREHLPAEFRGSTRRLAAWRVIGGYDGLDREMLVP